MPRHAWRQKATLSGQESAADSDARQRLPITCQTEGPTYTDVVEGRPGQIKSHASGRHFRLAAILGCISLESLFHQGRAQHIRIQTHYVDLISLVSL